MSSEVCQHVQEVVPVVVHSVPALEALLLVVVPEHAHAVLHHSLDAALLLLAHEDDDAGVVVARVTPEDEVLVVLDLESVLLELELLLEDVDEGVVVVLQLLGELGGGGVGLAQVRGFDGRARGQGRRVQRLGFGGGFLVRGVGVLSRFHFK